MWYQKDWFTGSDYYNLKEKQIHAEEIEIKKPLEQKFHERTEIYYVKSGDALRKGFFSYRSVYVFVF